MITTMKIGHFFALFLSLSDSNIVFFARLHSIDYPLCVTKLFGQWLLNHAKPLLVDNAFGCYTVQYRGVSGLTTIH